MFTAIVLDGESRKACIARAQDLDLIGDFPKVHCHHVTLCMGALPYEVTDPKRTVVVTHYGRIKGRVSAFRVAFASDSRNEVPHVTIATSDDAKPRESNDIREWIPVANFTLTGTVQICG